METAIQTKDLTKEYRQGKNIVMGVDHVNILSLIHISEPTRH